MVSQSFSSSTKSSPPHSPSSMPARVYSDHSYSKSEGLVPISESLPSMDHLAIAPSWPMDHLDLGSTVQGGTQKDPTLSSDRQSTKSNIAKSSSNNNGSNDSDDFEDLDMLCDLDDLDLSLSDFDMDTGADALSCSFQEFVDSTLSLTSLHSPVAAPHWGLRDTAVASPGETVLSPSTPRCSLCGSGLHSCPHTVGGTFTQHDSEATTSRAVPICGLNHSGLNANATDSGSLAAGSGKQVGSSAESHDGAGVSTPQDRQPHVVPTKKCSCLRSGSDRSSQVSVYSSCHRGSTTVCSSTAGSYNNREETPGMQLKPGDYLPPLYIDTQSFGVSADLSCSSPNSQNSLPHQHATDSTPTSSSSTTKTMCTSSNYELPQFETSDVFPSSQHKHHHQQQQTGSRNLEDTSFAETPSIENGSSMDELDLELISDFQSYLTEAGLDLRKLTPPTPFDSPLSSHSTSPTHQPFDSAETTCGLGTHTIRKRGCHRNIPADKDSDEFSVPGLRLSILHDFAEHFDDDTTFHTTEHSQKYSTTQGQLLGKLETSSWLDMPGLRPTHAVPSTPGTSPATSPRLGVSNSSAASPLSPGERMEWNSETREDIDILDLFSDDNAHAFLDSDSVFCRMHASHLM